MNPKKIKKIITKFIKEKVSGANADGIVIGISGGIDSAVVAKLCADALGKDKVLGLIMPTEVTPENDVSDAVNFAESHGIEYKIINITTILKSFLDEIKENGRESKTASGNLMARVRMCLLYYHANSLNRLVAGTGNKSEILCGYFTKFGDGGCDLLPIGDLYKTQVRELAKYLEIPGAITEKVPSAGFWHGQSDEEELGISYKILDKILIRLIDKKQEIPEIFGELKIEKELAQRVEKLVKESAHKRHTPGICRIEI